MTADRIALAYFAYLAVAAWLVPRTRLRRRVGVSLLALAIALLAWKAAERQPLGETWHAWLPIGWLVLGYWLPAALWRGPMPRVEAWLQASDRWLTREAAHDTADAASTEADRASSRMPIAQPLLEAAYLLVHAIVPAACLVLLLGGHAAHVDRFWSAVLIAGYACYGTLPWIQTRPPRLLPASSPTVPGPHLSGPTVSVSTMSVSTMSAPASSAPTAHAPASSPASPARSPSLAPRLRRLNLRLLDLVSIRVNTFPSGHAAIALIVALCLTSVSPIAGIVFLAFAVLIAAATIAGRYHYTADTLLGLIIALLVWTLVWRQS